MTDEDNENECAAENHTEEELKRFISSCEEIGGSSDETLKMVNEVSRRLVVTNLDSLSIDGSEYFRFTDELVHVMTESLLVCKISLRGLSLRHHRITDVGAVEICQLILPEFEEMRPLRQLDLEGNDIESTGCSSLRDCLLSSNCALETLNLSWNPLESAGGQFLSEALSSNRSLKSLKLANCDFCLSTLIAISTSLANNEQITDLTLDRPIVSTKQEENGDHLSRLLGSHPSLETLSLRYSKLGCHSCLLLSQELVNNNALISLNLECNSIGIKGAEALASYLMEVDKLRSLKLTSNRICNDGAIAMASAIRTNKSLVELTLRHNDIGQEGLVAIGNALYKNNSLKELSLWGNSFDDVSCGLFHDLYETRIPYIGLSLDCCVYIVDKIHCVAEKAL